MNSSGVQIKQILEEAFDIPFVLKELLNGYDPAYFIHPLSQGEELFEAKITFRQSTRIIIEIYPERYAAAMISDMCNASDSQKELFKEYAELLIEKMRASVDFQINNNSFNPCDSTSWPQKWNSFTCRISKSPVTTDDDIFNPSNIAGRWVLPAFGMFLSLLNIVPVESEAVEEGAKYSVISNRYERNPVNRQLCLAANGYKCKICGFDFEAAYGVIGRGFIHVHHIEPVSKYAQARIIDPKSDLIPVCPNCHAMLHKSDPPMLPDELRNILNISNKEAQR